MRKTAAIFSAALVLCGAASFAACKGSEDLSVYAPDGAPALALAEAILHEEQREKDLFDFDIVDASMITAYVTGERPKADICILPVNQAAKTLGSGKDYALLGTVTNGNLYFLSTGENLALEKDNLKETLAGKRIGVVQLTNVPGLTLQVVLKDFDISYRIAQSAEEEVSEGEVNLIPFQPADVSPAGGCDYYLCPEPAASAKIKGTASSQNPMKMAGDLQALYGEQDGYPQAVIVAKKSVLKSRRKDVETLIDELRGAQDFLQSAEINMILHLLDEEREDGVTPSFNANNLTYDVISRCSVRYTAASECREKIDAFLGKLIAVNASAAALPEDGFYDMG